MGRLRLLYTRVGACVVFQGATDKWMITWALAVPHLVP